MANNYFQFKQFTVYQDKTAMKVGTDGVLLGALAWTKENATPKHILDIGTGTGLVALMACQRFANACTDGIEIDADATEQAQENFEKSPFANRLKAIHCDVKDYQPDEKYDLIVSNPPYFIDSLQAPDAQRNIARHAVTLDCFTFAKAVSRLLKEDGECAVVFPAQSIEILSKELEKEGLTAKEIVYIKPNKDKIAKRVVATYSKKREETVVRELVMEKERHVYTDEFKAVVGEFYLDRD